jgi:hypothetical protein
MQTMTLNTTMKTAALLLIAGCVVLVLLTVIYIFIKPCLPVNTKILLGFTGILIITALIVNFPLMYHFKERYTFSGWNRDLLFYGGASLFFFLGYEIVMLGISSPVCTT